MIGFLAGHPWIEHIPEALVMQLVFGFLLWLVQSRWVWAKTLGYPSCFGATVAVTWFYARKKLEYEWVVVGCGHDKSPAWWQGYTIIEWLVHSTQTQAYVLQFIAPALAVIAVAWAMSHFRRT